jgi:CubicO group peptidase (beta-lactamase class C family)
MIVEKLSGKPFARYVQDRIFAPAQMTQTTYGDSSVIVPNRSPGAYQFIDGSLKQHFYPYPPVLYPAAGANSSLADLARFFAALDSDRLVNHALRTQMWTPTRLLDGKPVKYGLGWGLEDLNGHSIAEHSGAGSVWLAYIPDQRLAVVFLTNLNGVEHEFEKTLPHGDPILAIAERYLVQ